MSAVKTYMLRKGEPGRTAQGKIVAYVESDDPALIAGVLLLEEFNNFDMTHALVTKSDDCDGTIVSINYSIDPVTGEYTWGSGDRSYEAVAQVADHEFSKFFGGPDLWQMDRWLEIYQHEARAIRRVRNDRASHVGGAR